MKNVSDILTVSFDSGVKDESALCVTRKYGEKTIMLKMELGEQADILYHLLTEQMTKAEIKAESEDADNYYIKMVTNAKDAENYPISKGILKDIEEIKKMIFENRQSESEE